MTGHPYIDPLGDAHRLMRRIHEEWPAPDEAPGVEVMALMDQAIDKCPHVTDFWMLKAQLLQLQDEVDSHAVAECFETAVRIDRDCLEAHDALGAYSEEVLGDLERAEQAYLRSSALGGGPWVYVGLARVLAKQDRWDEAAASLDAEFCPYHDEPAVEEARGALEGGRTDF